MSEPYRKLYRSRTHRMIAGVAGGLGEYFGIDPTLVRLAFVFTALAGGPGLVAYIIMMIVIPEEPLTTPASGEATAQEAPPVEPEAEPQTPDEPNIA
ncbi:MAG: PspC domain-containing protein [Anaerolineales bacterium]|jgi:phage shock protein C